MVDPEACRTGKFKPVHNPGAGKTGGVSGAGGREEAQNGGGVDLQSLRPLLA